MKAIIDVEKLEDFLKGVYGDNDGEIQAAMNRLGVIRNRRFSICRVMLHIFIDGVCAECGMEEGQEYKTNESE